MHLAKTCFVLLALLGSVAAVTGRGGDEPVTIVRLENERVRVVEIDYRPGDVAPQHRHEYPRTVYTISGGSLQLTAPDGAVTTVDLADGQTIWRPSETHVVANTGATRVRVLETEIK